MNNHVNPILDAKNQLNELIMNAIGCAVSNNTLPPEPMPAFNIEIPSDTKKGDFATNVAMISAKAFHKSPLQIAKAIVDEMVFVGTQFEKAEIAGPGFINFFLNRNWFSNVIKSIDAEQENFGRTSFGSNKKVMVEFVSANPTGPMHIGNARGGAIGDCLASVLDWAGYDVTKEFYVNDAGNQINKFAISLEARYLEIFGSKDEFPEDAYKGEDIIVHAKNFADANGDKYVNATEQDRRNALVNFALPINVANLKKDLLRYRIDYDVWFLESTLHNNNEVTKCIDILTENGLTYKSDDGALFYKASEYGGEKDEVLVRANGVPTYFAADIAYHYNKFAVRNFDKVINVWGADHHGHVLRLKGAMDAVGLDGNKLDVVLTQMVRLVKGGEIIKASKRSGKAITLITLLDEVPIDAARFFFNLREANSHLDFDLDLAVSEGSQNPVYYVQYAHARICSIVKNLNAEKIVAKEVSKCNLDLLTAPEEIELIRHLAILPNEIIEAAKAYDPARITRYSVEIATLFHKFYNACRVKCDNDELMFARLSLCIAVKIAIKNVLTLLKISAPETM